MYQDLKSRGTSNIKKFVKSIVWKEGPLFLQLDEKDEPAPLVCNLVSDSDGELKKVSELWRKILKLLRHAYFKLLSDDVHEIQMFLAG